MINWAKLKYQIKRTKWTWILLLIAVIFPIYVMGYNYLKQSREDTLLVTKEIKYQKFFEKKITEDLTKMLSKLYGEKRHLVTVHVNLKQVKEHIQKLTYTPQNFKESRSHNLEQKKNSQDQLIGQNQNQKNEQFHATMPGYIPNPMRLNESEQLTEPQHGFPVLNQERRRPRQANNELTKKELSFETKNELNEERVYFDQERSDQHSPTVKIENLFLSIIIDKSQFEFSNISKEDLTQLIENVGGVDLSRGDQILIKTIPFRNGIMGLEFFMKSLLPFIKKYQKIVFGTLLIILLGGTGYGTYKTLRYLRERAKQRRLKKEEEAEKVEEEIIQTENDILNNRIQEISDYAKKKPKEFAKLISNLILSEMREEGVYKT